jgi:hypothetical protein
MALEERYFHVVKQHFEEGLFNKRLSYEQALEIARIVMNHADSAPKHKTEIGEEQKQLDDGKTIQCTKLPTAQEIQEARDLQATINDVLFQHDQGIWYDGKTIDVKSGATVSVQRQLQAPSGYNLESK